jgi:hypothetical protein
MAGRAINPKHNAESMRVLEKFFGGTDEEPLIQEDEPETTAAPAAHTHKTEDQK